MGERWTTTTCVRVFLLNKSEEKRPGKINKASKTKKEESSRGRTEREREREREIKSASIYASSREKGAERV